MNQSILAIAGLGTPELIVIVLVIFYFSAPPGCHNWPKPSDKARRLFVRVSKKANARIGSWRSSSYGHGQR